VTPYAIVTAALRGESVPPPSASEARAVRELAELHGVHSLLYRKLEGTAAWSEWPDTLREGLAVAARDQVAAEMARKAELTRVLEALAAEGIEPLILKGAALAYTHYDEPSCRSRGDSDLLIREREREAADRVLLAMGYEPWTAAGGELATYQQLYASPHHRVDLHWKISNAQLFAAALPYDELDAEAVKVAALGEHARTLCPTHALFLALLHRATHVNAPYYVDDVAHYEQNRLIWLYDLHLLAGALKPEEWDRFLSLARDKGMRAICFDGLMATRQALGVQVPAWVVKGLQEPGPPELSAAYLRRGGLRQILVELRALPSWPERAMLLKDLALPPADYMLDKYETDRRALLPWLYLRRAVGGVAKAIGKGAVGRR
jgi:hypothetical protein